MFICMHIACLVSSSQNELITCTSFLVSVCIEYKGFFILVNNAKLRLKQSLFAMNSLSRFLEPMHGAVSYLAPEGITGPDRIMIDELTRVTFEKYANCIMKMGFATCDGVACDFAVRVRVMRDGTCEVAPEGIEGDRRYFFLSWEHSYDVFVDDMKFFTLGMQKQQFVRPTQAAKQLYVRVEKQSADRLKQEAERRQQEAERLANEMETLDTNDDD